MDRTAKIKKRIEVLTRLINSFKDCRKLVRRYCAELLDKEQMLQQLQKAVYSIASNGQLLLF